MSLRNLAPVAPFVARWDWPLFRRADGLDPNRLKQVGGRPVSHTAETLLELIGNDRLSTAEWKRLAADEYGVTRSRFYPLLKALVEAEKVAKSRVDGKWEQIRTSSQNWYDEKDQ